MGQLHEGAHRTGDRTIALIADALAAAPSPANANMLTHREQEVLALVAHGFTDVAIAQQLVVSPHTVHRQVANIRTKLNLLSRAAAARLRGPTRSGVIATMASTVFGGSPRHAMVRIANLEEPVRTGAVVRSLSHDGMRPPAHPDTVTGRSAP